MASGRRLRSRGSIASAQQQQQLSDCGHDRSYLDFSLDRDIKCKVCWENREILIQRLIEPFELALETLKVDDGSASVSVNSTPERASSTENAGIAAPGRTRSLRRRAGQKRTRSISPIPVTTAVAATTTPMKTDGEGLLGPSKPDEEDCIHVQDISVAIPPRPEKKRSKSPEQAKMVKIAALEPREASANIITPAGGKAGNASGGTTEKLQENPSPPLRATPTPTPIAKLQKLQEKSTIVSPNSAVKPTKFAKPRTSLPSRKGQQTLFSFFTKPTALPVANAKIEDSVTVKSENPMVSRAVPKPAPIFGGGGGVGSGGGGAKKKDVAAKATEEVVVVRKSTTPPPARLSRAGTRKSAREVTVKSRETVNYREDSDSDIDLE